MFEVLAHVLDIKLYCGGDFFKSLSRRRGAMDKCYWFEFRQCICEYG